MDQALHLVIEMNQWIWGRFREDLKDATPEEIDWRPLPQANNIAAIVRHLRIEAACHLASLEQAEPMPDGLSGKLRRLVDATATDFEENFQELERSFTRFVAALEATTTAALEQRTSIAYQNFPSATGRPAHLLGFHQALHLAMHLGQIRSIRNLFRKTRGEPARFFPENPTFPT